jgi:hypothetical protein
MKVNSLTDYGRKRANPLASATNNIRLSACDVTGDVVGEDYKTGTVAAARTVVSATIDGVEYALISTQAELETNLLALVRRLEADPVKIIYSLVGTTLTITHYGATTIEKLVFDDASEFVFARAETITLSHKYTFSVIANGDDDLIVGGTTEAIDVPAAVTAGANETALKDAIDAGGYTLTETTVVVANLSGDTDVFDVTIYVNQDDGAPTFAGNSLTYVWREDQELFS